VRQYRRPRTVGGGPSAEKSLILATTTSTQDSGLLDELLPAFTRDSGWQVKTLAVGSGQAIELGRRGEADVLLVHSPAAEQAFVAEGTAGQRRLVMHNDFVLVGPANDPPGSRLGQRRGGHEDRRGAGAVRLPRRRLGHQRPGEGPLEEGRDHPRQGSWYQATGQGMGATLRVASEKAGYTLSDRATYLAQRDTLALDVLSEGDPGLLNVYHVIEMTTRAGERVQPDGARAFADWITGRRRSSRSASSDRPSSGSRCSPRMRARMRQASAPEHGWGVSQLATQRRRERGRTSASEEGRYRWTLLMDGLLEAVRLLLTGDRGHLVRSLPDPAGVADSDRSGAAARGAPRHGAGPRPVRRPPGDARGGQHRDGPAAGGGRLFVTVLLWRSGPLGAFGLLYTPTAMVIAQAVIATPDRRRADGPRRSSRSTRASCCRCARWARRGRGRQRRCSPRPGCHCSRPAWPASVRW
jgi:tungstate transport system substrate-binding protein